MSELQLLLSKLSVRERTLALLDAATGLRVSKETFAEIYSGEILQVVSNLLANALDPLPEGGTISLRLRTRDSHVQLLVADNGHGMAPHHVARLFEPFFTTKENRGTGLGLALSKKIIERHSGTITARSSALVETARPSELRCPGNGMRRPARRKL